MIVEYVLLCLFFYYLLENKVVRKIILFSIIPFAIFYLYTFLTFGFGKYQPRPSVLEFTILLTILCYYFFEKMQKITLTPMYTTISFWLCVGLLLHFAGSFFSVLLINSKSNLGLLKQMRSIFLIVGLTKNLILCFAWFGKEPIGNQPLINIPDGLNLDADLPFKEKNNP
jgi:uncharacterized membrane protein